MKKLPANCTMEPCPIEIGDDQCDGIFTITVAGSEEEGYYIEDREGVASCQHDIRLTEAQWERMLTDATDSLAKRYTYEDFEADRYYHLSRGM